MKEMHLQLAIQSEQRAYRFYHLEAHLIKIGAYSDAAIAYESALDAAVAAEQHYNAARYSQWGWDAYRKFNQVKS